MFHYALDVCLGNEVEPSEYWDNEDDQRRWLAMDPEERLMRIAGKLWFCTDIMPGDTCDDLHMLSGSTYAQACRKIRQGFVTPAASV